MKNMTKKLLSLLLSVMLVAALAVNLTACGEKEPTTPTGIVSLEEGKTYGTGATAFTLSVVDKEGQTVTVTINTDKKTVGEALTELNLISGTDSEYGLMVDTVNGIHLNWDEDQMYWAFYIDGEYAQTGVDSTDVVAGSTYTFEATKG